MCWRVTTLPAALPSAVWDRSSRSIRRAARAAPPHPAPPLFTPTNPQKYIYVLLSRTEYVACVRLRENTDSDLLWTWMNRLDKASVSIDLSLKPPSAGTTHSDGGGRSADPTTHKQSNEHSVWWRSHALRLDRRDLVGDVTTAGSDRQSALWGTHMDIRAFSPETKNRGG
ncbi:hypothetical protein EVAR_68794_1 [Eumeta japonica]|uniref:Uncharacterized protein n=1 Tax=Eumeta variegata TaxID=151549 RepID=A0A4C1ZY68_EUMVA|nr:hypothetical protein EVAR_68794_1 [Eumeta japonica]